MITTMISIEALRFRHVYIDSKFCCFQGCNGLCEKNRHERRCIRPVCWCCIPFARCYGPQCRGNRMDNLCVCVPTIINSYSDRIPFPVTLMRCKGILQLWDWKTHYWWWEKGLDGKMIFIKSELLCHSKLIFKYMCVGIAVPPGGIFGCYSYFIHRSSCMLKAS